MSDQGKANYEGYRAATLSFMPPWDELTYQAKLGYDAGAASVEALLASEHDASLEAVEADIVSITLQRDRVSDTADSLRALLDKATSLPAGGGRTARKRRTGGADVSGIPEYGTGRHEDWLTQQAERADAETAVTPDLFARWFRIVYPYASQQTIDENREGRPDDEQEFWRELDAQAAIAAQQPQATPADASGLLEPLHALAAKWDATAARNQRNGQSLLDQGDEYGNEGLAIAEALGACVIDLRAVLADAPEQPAPELAAATPPLGTAWRLLGETRAERDPYLEGILTLIDGLKTTAAATHPSKKSEIEFDLIRKLRAILDLS